MTIPVRSVVTKEFCLVTTHLKNAILKKWKSGINWQIMLSYAGYFKEVISGMDIRYRLESEVVKEEVLLKNKEAATAKAGIRRRLSAACKVQQ